MADYKLAIGTHDPETITAEGEADAIRQAVERVRGRYAPDLDANPQEVATLLGPAGLVTRPSERIDEFVTRLPVGGGADMVQPGDSNTPDCNGD